MKALARVDPTSYQWRLAKWSIEKIPSRERALSRRKCGREGKRLLMQNIGMRPHCCERFEGEMNLLIMHKLTKDPPPCPQDLWTRPTSDFPSKLTNLCKCWSFMQFQTGAVCLWKPTHFHVSIWMGMVVGGRLPIMKKQTIELALSEISSYLNPPQMSVRVFYFRYAVESNIARDRIAETFAEIPKYFENAMQLLYLTFIINRIKRCCSQERKVYYPISAPRAQVSNSIILGPNPFVGLDFVFRITRKKRSNGVKKNA